MARKDLSQLSTEEIDAMIAAKNPSSIAGQAPSKKNLAQYAGDFGKAIQETSTVKAGTSFVDALGNMMLTIGNTAISPFTEQRAQMQNTVPGEGFAKSLGRSAGTAFGLIGLGAGIGAGTTKGLQATGAAIPSTQKATGYLTSGKAAPSAAGRFGEAATSTALLSPDETLKAAEEALLYQAIFESIPYLSKGAKGSLDYIPGAEYMKEMTARMKRQMNTAEKEAGVLFKQAEEAGAGKVLNIQPAKPGEKAKGAEFNYLTGKFIPESAEIPAIPAQTTLFTEQLAANPFAFNKQAKETYEAFLGNPSYENAFKLQSDLGAQARKISSKTHGDILIKEQIEAARDALKKDIDISLLGEGSEASGYLRQAMRKFATEVAPTRENAKFMQIAEGLMGPIGTHTREGMLEIPSIKEMQTLLKKELSATKKGGGYRFPETHPFHKELADLNERAGRSLMASFNPLAIIAHGLNAGTAKEVNMFKLLQNPEILNALATAGETTRFAGPKASAGIAGGQ